MVAASASSTPVASPYFRTLWSSVEREMPDKVAAVAGMIEAAHFMQDPKNADAVAEAAAVTGHNKDVNKEALKAFLGIDFWAPRTTACRATSSKPPPA